MNLTEDNQNISDICDIIEEYQALIQISPGYINDLTEVEKMDPETPDYPDELSQYNHAIEEWIDMDQMETLREAFPKDYAKR